MSTCWVRWSLARIMVRYLMASTTGGPTILLTMRRLVALHCGILSDSGLTSFLNLLSRLRYKRRSGVVSFDFPETAGYG
jgi:hypothetical protein